MPAVSPSACGPAPARTRTASSFRCSAPAASWSKYSNPAFDAAVDAARSTLDPAKRNAEYKKAYEILRQDVPGLGLYQSFATYAARKELQWQPTPNESLFVMDMSWK